MPENDTDNELFQLAVRFVNQTDRHLFVTGKAGTGKTTFLRHIKDNTFKKMVVLAPTGVAAINAGGVTIHSFFQLPFGPFVANHRSGWNQQQPVTNQHTLLKNIRFTANKRQLLQELDMVVIDEVSMMRCDMLDAIDHVLRHFRRKPHIPFGGVQMIYIGDLFQLPPVIKNDEWELLKENYKSPFFFDAMAVQQFPPLYLELKKIYRQSEASFIDLLNNIRNNQITKPDLAQLHAYYDPGFLPAKKDNYITLTSHNAKAEYINNRELEILEGTRSNFLGEIKGDFSEKALPAEMKLQLKEGAQIMFLKNDKGENRKFFNGKIGNIGRITDENIFIKFPGEATEMQLEKETWKNIRYTFNEEKNKMEEEEAGTFTQYPIRLAWAITIHKSQGLTFDKAIIDAGASFAAGQVYVALSRLTSLKGLVLYSKIQGESICTDQRVIDFTREEKDSDALQTILREEQLVYTGKLLLQSFSWSKIISSSNKLIDDYPARNIPGKIAAVKWARELNALLVEQEEVSKKFLKQLQQILSEPNSKNYLLLRERIGRAEKYFSEQLMKISASVHWHIKEYKAFKRIKQYLTDLENLDHLISWKKKELLNAVEMANSLAALTETGRSSDRSLDLRHNDQNPESLLSEALPHQ
ncbi:MAG: AAA family ATPase [Chitinophagaceae bacterium]|nr:AAA family ATPase [Chitinophagaceae bacterium]